MRKTTWMVAVAAALGLQGLQAVEIPYRQLTPEKALETYCDWIVSQMPRFKDPPFEWYFLFYPMRTLLMGANLLNRPDYAEAVWPFMDRYIDEQLPNGALTANCRGQPGATMSQQDIEDLLTTGKLNLADNGSNVHGLLLGAVTTTDVRRRERYIAAAKKWLDCWVPIWRLSTGAYGNGIWFGHKLNGPYSMAMNVCSAMAAFTLITGDEHYIRNAEKFALFQCDNWHELGVPIRLDVYPTPSANSFCGDFGRIYYLFEALAWTHYVSKDPKVRARIAERLRQWIDADLIKRWPADRDWFDMNKCRCQVYDEKFKDSGDGVRFYWQACKAAGMSGLLSYYVNNVEDRADLRDRVSRGGRYLSNPLKARMLAVMADDVEPTFCMQATGFGGLGVAEALKPMSTFDVYKVRK